MAKSAKANGDVLAGMFEPAELQEMATQRARRKSKAPSGKPDASVQRCIKAFYEAYVRRHNPLTSEKWLAEAEAKVPIARRSTSQSEMILPMISGGKDGSLMKKMLATWGEERVLELIEDFFGDAYTMFGVINSNQDIGALFAAAPKILVREHATMSRKTLNNLEAASQAMQRPSLLPMKRVK